MKEFHYYILRYEQIGFCPYHILYSKILSYYNSYEGFIVIDYNYSLHNVLGDYQILKYD